jgi:hypothetical protein
MKATMGTITQQTAYDIWMAHREVETANKLKKDLADKKRFGDDPTPMDAFGRRRMFQLGVPSGENAHRLFDVPPTLMPYVLDVHIAAQEKKLAEACVMAQMELDGLAPAEKSATPMQIAAE